MTTDILDRIAELRARSEDFCLVTVVRTQNATSAKAGAKAIITKSGEWIGYVGGACVQGAAERAARDALSAGAPRLIRVKPKEDVLEQLDADGVELHKSSCPSGGTVELFIEPTLTAPRCLICGTSPVAVSLLALLKAMGYRTIHAAAARQDIGPARADVNVAGYDFSHLDISARDFIIIATQGKRDREALAAALESDARFVAFVGSRRKAAALRTEIAENGLPSRRIERLRAPAGLDIGAIEPEEIAISIIGDIVQSRRSTMPRADVVIDEEAAALSAGQTTDMTI